MTGGRTKPESLGCVGLLGLGLVAFWVLSRFFGSASEPALSRPGELVKRTLKLELKARVKTYRFEDAPLDGGIAVLLNDSAAYWIREGSGRRTAPTVYALNELARSYSPGIEWGPPDLTLAKVRKALGR